jgi:hypothetical protein
MLAVLNCYCYNIIIIIIMAVNIKRVYCDLGNSVPCAIQKNFGLLTVNLRSH